MLGKYLINNGTSDGGLMVTIGFSATENLTIESLVLHNVTQDGIFVRNGGVNTLIKNNLVDGFDMLSYNGGGINIEMYNGGNLPATKESQVV